MCDKWEAALTTLGSDISEVPESMTAAHAGWQSTLNPSLILILLM